MRLRLAMRALRLPHPPPLVCRCTAAFVACSLVAVLAATVSWRSRAFAECTPGQVCDAVSIACDAAATARIDVAGQHNLHRLTFDVGDREIIEVVVAAVAPSGSNFRPTWRLLDQAGTTVAPCDSFSEMGRADCGPLSNAGNPYRIEVGDATNTSVGSYQIYLQRLTAPESCPGNFKPCSIDPPSDTDLVSFVVNGSSEVSIQLEATEDSGENFEPYWRVLDASGTPVKRCGAFTLAEEVECGVLPVSGNPYRLEVTDFFNDDIGSFTASIDDRQLCLQVGPCAGDCNGNGSVAVGELVLGVNIALGNVAATECPALARDGDGKITIDELVAAVSNAANSCH